MGWQTYKIAQTWHLSCVRLTNKKLTHPCRTKVCQYKLFHFAHFPVLSFPCPWPLKEAQWQLGSELWVFSLRVSQISMIDCLRAPLRVGVHSLPLSHNGGDGNRAAVLPDTSLSHSPSVYKARSERVLGWELGVTRPVWSFQVRLGKG